MNAGCSSKEDNDDFPTIDTEEANKKLEEYFKLDQILGQPYFVNKPDQETYRKAMKYFDASGFSDIVLNAVGYLYEFPCPLSVAKSICKTMFSSNGEAKGLDTIQIKNEIQACSYRIELLKEEIKDWFVVCVKLLKNRKVHNPYGFADPLKFDSLHLLNAFSIYSRPEDYPDVNFSDDEPEAVVPEVNKTKDPDQDGEYEGEDAKSIEKKVQEPHPYLVEPGETFLNKSVQVKWCPFETDKDIRRECLKYADIKDGIPKDLNVYFEPIRKPHAGLLPAGKPAPPSSGKWTQTPPIPVKLEIAVLEETSEEDENCDEFSENDYDENRKRLKSSKDKGKKQGTSSKSRRYNSVSMDERKKSTNVKSKTKNSKKEKLHYKHGEKKSENYDEKRKSRKYENKTEKGPKRKIYNSPNNQ
ncbi:hypothetical protein O3M35_003623 [Rhynocoris fuscipes]|uniref:Uncharacterized protein n=1 Tax=Rhynocoris fuscipes TaxID=488301 RepID=A0AAW1CN30_9HEMI